MDYQKLIEAHRDNNADVTIAVSSNMRYKDPSYFNVRVGKENQVVEFIECQGKSPIQSKVSFYFVFIRTHFKFFLCYYVSVIFQLANIWNRYKQAECIEHLKIFKL